MSSLLESLEKAAVKLYRKRVARRLFEQSSRSVRYGPFEGMALGGRSHLSFGPLVLKLFGLYETEVVDVLTGLGGMGTLVNLGAGDGYYSIGLIRAGIVRNSLCFELDETGRAMIARSAELNGVADRIRVFGAAGGDLVDVLIAEGVAGAGTVLLCDIEGAEFEVISDRLVAALRASVFVIEIHTFAVKDGEAKLEALTARLAPTHDVVFVKDRPRDWSGIPELETLPDNARALAASEGRKALGLWLVARPRQAS